MKCGHNISVTSAASGRQKKIGARIPRRARIAAMQ